MWNQIQLPQDERDDFLAGCAALDIDASQFALAALENVPLEPGPIDRRVIVAKGKKKLEFNGGNGTNWIGPALDAIKRGDLNED